MLEATTNCRHFTHSDIGDAGADFFAQVMGARVRNPHPVATQLKLRELSLAEAAYILGERELLRRGREPKTANAVVSAGLGTDDFGTVLEAATARVVAQAYMDAAEHRTLLHPYPVSNYRPAEIGVFDVDVDTGELGELEEIPQAQVDLPNGNSGQVEAYAVNLVVGYRVIVNNNVQAVAMLSRAAAISAARREARRFYAFLDGNPTLADGNPMFSAGAGNLITGSGGLSASSLGSAMAALREQKTPGGQYANHRLTKLLVHSGDEQVGRQLVRETGIEAAVVASPWISSGDFYAMAGADVAPAIAMLYLGPPGDTEMQTVRVSRRPADRVNRRTGIEVAHDFGFAAVSRLGVVKVSS